MLFQGTTGFQNCKHLQLVAAHFGDGSAIVVINGKDYHRDFDDSTDNYQAFKVAHNSIISIKILNVHNFFLFRLEIATRWPLCTRLLPETLRELSRTAKW